MDDIKDYVEIFHSEKKGRGIRPFKKLGIGEKIFEEKCYAACIKRAYVSEVCANCMIESNNVTSPTYPFEVYKCKHCEKISYCCKECQVEDISIHKTECKWLQNINGIPTVLTRLVGRILIKEKSGFKWSELDLFKGCSDRISDFDREIYCEGLAEIRLYIPKSFLPSLETTQEMLWAINLNGVSISSYDSPEIGVGLFPYFSLINHSCTPNSCRSFLIGNILRLFTMTEIDVGEEITITYIDLAPPTSLRQAELRQYQMTCTCSKCTCPETYALQCLDTTSTPEFVLHYIEKLENIFKETNFTIDTLYKLKSIEEDIKRLFPPVNVVWAYFYRAASDVIRRTSSIESAQTYGRHILDSTKLIYSRYSVNYFYESLYFCIVSLVCKEFKLPRSYCNELLVVAKVVYGSNDRIVPFISNQLNSNR